ncbi:hypothetical protein [Pseudomonas syringae]|uniref:hypothetical protein n=1 Tax=Pseudomonas syringae TaxID=317 RepID=UPI001F3EDDA5|nr:hypothetical protein [Pseudomonas syringae]MCF5371989.1 hypothetical protein [Pseudomonas syringae]MCF5382014.1 hypothetical protein [Pseudomonas syringae]MCF5419453.1 hypothetical protein [Pseudomonas syringae]MCF5451999.1 hypothetical protein [Pseudomonas syringae]MCF5456286.1 hypothetical protein [Pseudomonas syringae]
MSNESTTVDLGALREQLAHQTNLRIEAQDYADRLQTQLNAAQARAIAVKAAVLKTAKKWFYSEFEDDLLQQMQDHRLIAQAEGFSISMIASLELEIESGFQITQTDDSVAGETTKCEWAYQAADFNWHSGCGAVWSFNDEGPEENGMNFCHACGKPLAIALAEDEGLPV